MTVVISYNCAERKQRCYVHYKWSRVEEF